MPYFKFIDDIEPHKGKIERISDNVVKLILEDDIPVNISGFRTYRDYEMHILLGDFENFTTQYDNGFILSNDGSSLLQKEPASDTSEQLVYCLPTMIASEVGSTSAFGNSSIVRLEMKDSNQQDIYIFLSHACNNSTDLKFELSGSALESYEIIKELRSASAKSTSNFLLLKVKTKGLGDIEIHSSSQLAISTSNAMAFRLS